MANDESNDGSNEVVHDVDTLVEKPSPRDTPATKKSSYKKGSKNGRPVQVSRLGCRQRRHVVPKRSRIVPWSIPCFSDSLYGRSQACMYYVLK